MKLKLKQLLKETDPSAYEGLSNIKNNFWSGVKENAKDVFKFLAEEEKNSWSTRFLSKFFVYRPVC